MNRRRARRRTAFTLLEMMLVVVIIGLLATVVVVNFAGRSEKALTELTKTKLSQIKGALTEYNISNGNYPSTLLALQTSKLLEKVPQDGWKHEFVYIFPGSSGNPDQPYDLYSLGKDNQGGTPDDVNVWTMDTR